jgi:outer membrane protein assembly factor BamB
VVRRIGPGAAGLTTLQARWVHPFTEQPFAGMGFPTTVGEHEGQVVLVDAGGAVYLVDPASGAVDPIGEDPESALPAGPASVVDGDQLFMTLGGELRAVDLPTGAVRWTDGSSSFSPNGPIVAGDLVIIARVVTLDDGSITDDVIAHDRLTGEVRWTQRMPVAGSGPALAGDVVIAGSPLSAIDPSDGSIIWQIEPDRDVVGNTAYDETRDMVVATVRQFQGDEVLLDLVAVDAQTGEERWRTSVDGVPEFTEAITIGDGLVVLPQLGGPVVGYDADTGVEQWRFAPPAPAVHLGIATIEEGRVWIITSFAQVFVLDASSGEVLAQSSGFGADVGSFFAPWGQQVRSVDGVFVAPFPPFVAGFDPPEER